jgi:undecaprenyl diphosphate synthase
MDSSIEQQLVQRPVPVHIAMIMDGNGRWAKERGMPRVFGHREGVNTVRRMVETCGRLGVGYLTLYAFSTENWGRPQPEVNALMELLVSTLRAELAKLHENQVRLHTIGRTADLPVACQKELDESMRHTAHNTGLNLILALSYSAKWDIVRAAQGLAKQAATGHIAIDDIDDQAFKGALSTCNFPDVELLIRTSGENRISNFLLWELAYAELYFSKTPWPEFSEHDLYTAIQDFQNRERRFGKTSEQLINEI